MKESRAIVRKRVPKQPLVRQLEFYAISAQDLRNVRSFHTMRTYIVAYVSPNQKVRSHTDEEGGTNPTWNAKLCLQVEERLLEEDSNAQLTFEIYSHAFLRDKLVGTVRLSLPDAVRPNRNSFPVTSYLIFTPDGDSEGMLNICVPPGGRLPKRLDSLSFKRVLSDHGVQLEAVPSFKQGVDDDDEEAEEEEDEEDVARGESSSTAVVPTTTKQDAQIDSEDEELGIYDESFFDSSSHKRSPESK